MSSNHMTTPLQPRSILIPDTLDRLTRAEYLVGVQTENEDFVYDKLGNRTTLKHNGTDVARYQHNDVNEYTYIGLGSGTNVTHDDAGNMTGDHDGYTYHYDYENRLTRVKKLSDTVDVAVYTYDALGRRIAVEDCIADTTKHYYYDGWRVLTETDENDDRQRDFAYGNYLDEALIMTVDASPDVDHYYAHDHLFSVVALVNESGNVIERYEYNAYGACTFLAANFTELQTQESSYDSDRLFTGKPLDILNGLDKRLQNNHDRIYDPDIGRFLQRDSLGTKPMAIHSLSRGPRFIGTRGYAVPNPNNETANLSQYLDGMNLYEYVKSNPIMLTDPLGGCSDSKSEPKVCFCVESLAINPSRVITGKHFGEFVGAEFTVVLTGTWKPDCKFKPFRYEWWEWYTERPTHKRYNGKPPEQWHEMYKGNEDHKTFKEVTQQCNKAKEGMRCTYRMTDRPGATIGFDEVDQTAYWDIRAFSSCANCPDMFVRAYQRYHFSRTNIYENSFSP